MTRIWRQFLQNDTAATVIEYALIAGFISIVILSATTLIGNLTGTFISVAAGLK